MHGKTHPMFVVAAIGASLMAGRVQAQPSGMWLTDAVTPADTYVAFRGQFELSAQTAVELRTLGASWYVVWLDGQYFLEGPDRFEARHPQYQSTTVTLPAGRHVLAVQVHHIGATTRILMDMPPFLLCEVFANGRPMSVEWKCTPLPGYRPQVRRINPQLGWIEWCDTRQNPADWQKPVFGDEAWSRPVKVELAIGEPQASSLGSVQAFTHKLTATAAGSLAEMFGYEFDDVPARFLLRDLRCVQVPAQGVWRRYDLGRVMLGRPRFVLDLPEGAVVEFAYAETLTGERVAPYITLSAGPSCNLDHYVARGGIQEFFPLTPKGGRFVEVHVLAPAEVVRFVREEYVERGYHGLAEGEFRCNDPLLERIWQVGVDTFRACSEDGLIDNPTRERGQWTGDVVTVGMDINAVAYRDLRLCRRGLMQSAWCAREDGLVAGLCPGGPAYLSTYAAQWINACMHFHELTGERDFLKQMYPLAQRNVAAFEAFVRDGGLSDDAGWAFVDWGYVRNEGPADIALNLHFLAALRAIVHWGDLIDQLEDKPRYEQLAARIENTLRRWFDERMQGASDPWPRIGYHNAVLGWRMGMIPKEKASECARYLKAHILNCFPNNPEAPRLSDPGANNRQLITPYFAHYAFPVLIELGEMDFVLDQYRKCWGWMLEGGQTTWIEVFDVRWSHCHQWAGCPTWQLSRYQLGLRHRFDLGKNHFVLQLVPGSLDRAAGRLPLLSEGKSVRVDWSRNTDGIRYRLECDEPLWLHLGTPDGEVVAVEKEFSTTLP